jgi:hypothetical protein
MASKRSYCLTARETLEIGKELREHTYNGEGDAHAGSDTRTKYMRQVLSRGLENDTGEAE